MYEALEIAQARRFLEEKAEDGESPLDLPVAQGATNFLVDKNSAFRLLVRLFS